MVNYFKNKDFNDYIHGLMIFSTGLAYNCTYVYSKHLGITWVDVPLGKLMRHTSPPLTPKPTIIYIFLFFFTLALFFSLRSCFNRIKAGEIHWKVGIQDWFKTIFAYFVAFLTTLVFIPPIIHFLRGW